MTRNTIISPDIDVSTPTLSDAECGGKVSHKHKHKKRSKRKHRHREREEKTSKENDLTNVDAQVEPQMKNATDETGLVVVAEEGLLVEDSAQLTESSQKSSLSITDEKSAKSSDNDNIVHGVVEPVSNLNEEENLKPQSVESTAEKSKTSPFVVKNKEKVDSEEHHKSNLVPYQDSSTTEVERTEDTSQMSGSDSDTDVPNLPATSPLAEEDEDIEESLLLDVHVDESIDELEEELMGGPVKKRETEQAHEKNEEANRETGECTYMYLESLVVVN